MNPLFTIGHSTHEFPRFLALLQQHAIGIVADVRSRPFSRLPWFSRPALEKDLKENGIRYVFLGTELGARRDERECYIGARVDYDRIARTPLFQEGLDRLKVGVGKARIVLMCAEKDPLDCHRTILVCRYAKEFADVFHIHADGNLESQEMAEARLLACCHEDAYDLFRSRIEQLNDAYKRRGEKIAYVEQPETSSVVRDADWNDEP